MNVVLMPDSFKGTLSARAFCAVAEEEIKKLDPAAAVLSLPVADGGEGTVDAFLTAVGGQRVEVPCQDPYGREIVGFYGLLPDGTAVIEMATAAGLPLVGEEKNPALTSTYGVGQLIAHAAHHGAKSIVLGLGGSATNDGGCGCAAALGVQFLNGDGKPFVPTGGTLKDIAAIDARGLDPAVKALPITAMCDIDNPLCGKEGAAAVFAPQKGADEEMVALLDDGLRHFAHVVRRHVGLDVLSVAGGGAAGGFGAGALALLGAELRRGFDTVLSLTEFHRRAKGADLVITGEGRLDSQSLRGKVVLEVARNAAALGVPAIALVGSVEEGCVPAALEAGLTAVHSINPPDAKFEEVRHRAAENLRTTVARVVGEYLGG